MPRLLPEAWRGIAMTTGQELQGCNPGDTAAAAARLFAALDDLDRPEYAAIAVMPIPNAGLGAAINDRLRRAATPREG